MLKTQFFLSFLFLFAISEEIPADLKIKSLQYLTECMHDWNVSFETVAKAIYSEDSFPQENNFKEFSFCMGKKTGVMDENGIWQTDSVKKNLQMVVDDDKEVNRLMEKCVSQYETPQETAYQVTNCFHLEGVTI